MCGLDSSQFTFNAIAEQCDYNVLSDVCEPSGDMHVLKDPSSSLCGFHNPQGLHAMNQSSAQHACRSDGHCMPAAQH